MCILFPCMPYAAYSAAAGTGADVSFVGGLRQASAERAGMSLGCRNPGAACSAALSAGYGCLGQRRPRRPWCAVDYELA
jgi:hypothetical protein